MAAVELHVNPTYYAQYPALKSVYGKDQSVLLCLVSYFRALLHIRTSPPPPLSLLLMTHHEETRLSANRSPNPNPKGGTKVQ